MSFKPSQLSHIRVHRGLDIFLFLLDWNDGVPFDRWIDRDETFEGPNTAHPDQIQRQSPFPMANTDGMS